MKKYHQSNFISNGDKISILYNHAKILTILTEKKKKSNFMCTNLPHSEKNLLRIFEIPQNKLILEKF